MAINLRPEVEEDAAGAFASEPLAELLKGFAEGCDGALVVCGPQRVRSMLGTTGCPGVLALAMAQCANALPVDSLLAVSAFFVLPEVEHPTCRLPCLDIMDGGRRASWEQCHIETFTDMHKAFSVLVRVCSNLLDTRGDITRKWQQYQECLGRLPLIFCLQLLRPWQSHPGIQSTRLFFAEAPPPVSGGPVPQHFLNATTRLQMGRCVVLHAALGGAPSNVALRSALGPLQRLAQKEKGTIPDVPVVSWDLQCLCRALVLQAEKAAQDLWQLCSMLRRCSEGEERLGSSGVPCCDSARLWRHSFGGIRQITQTELRRQYPLAILRSQSLRTLLLSMQSWDHQEPAALEEALRLLEGFEGVETERNGELLVDVAGLAWQQQWQVRHLVGCIHAAEERDRLLGEVEDLTDDLVAAQEELSSQQEAQRKDQQERQASEESLEWQLQRERNKCEALAAQLTASQEDVALLRQQMEHLELLLAESEHREQDSRAEKAPKTKAQQLAAAGEDHRTGGCGAATSEGAEGGSGDARHHLRPPGPAAAAAAARSRPKRRGACPPRGREPVAPVRRARAFDAELFQGELHST
ncbi:unnamed protein product [Durusdinium trenchii]|uniref:Uncharacterized protein n=1 Tax=Durusdinium trenchii TaxID=1381693 RepID=A0ABP0HK08_9DINO